MQLKVIDIKRLFTRSTSIKDKVIIHHGLFLPLIYICALLFLFIYIFISTNVTLSTRVSLRSKERFYYRSVNIYILFNR